MVTILSILIINGLVAKKGNLNKKSMFKKISLGLMMFLVFGMFSVVGVSKVQAADLACTIEYPDGRIEEGTWINGTCQPNGSVVVATDYKVNVKPVSFFEKIKLAFTFNALKKAELLANFSNRNFELARQEFSAGNITEANIFLQKSEDNNKKAEESASKIKEEEKKQKALSSLSVTASNRTTVLTEVKAKLESAQAKEAIQNAIDTQVEIKSSVDEKKDALIDLKLNADMKVDLKESEKEGNFSGVGNILGGVDVAVKGSVAGNSEFSCPGIAITSPQPNAQVTFPLTVSGIIHPSGTTFSPNPWIVFEGEAGAVVVKNASGVVIGTPTILSLSGEWMNTSPKPFSVVISSAPQVSNSQNLTLEFTDNQQSDEGMSHSCVMSVQL